MIRRLWSEQVRMTVWAWLATLGAAAMLAPLTESKQYLVVGGFGAALVAATGAVLRARRIHLVLVLLAEVFVACEWAVLSFARSEAVLGFLPGPDSVSDLRDRWSGYADVANHYAAPLPQHPDVTMAMATVLVLLAIVVDIVAVSWRRAALLGLVFLAIYMTPVSILGGRISVVSFAFGALGYVFLLAADERERLTHWGRQISTAGSMWDRPNEVDEGGLRRNGTRIGLGAIALAAVLPAFIPTLSPHYFGQSGSGGPDGGSGGTVEVTNPALDLRRNLVDQSDSVLLTVTTDDPNPEYFRLSALDHFDGDTWDVGARDNAVSTGDSFPAPADVGLLLGTSSYSYQVEVADSFQTTWLPLRYVPTSVDIGDGSWRADRTHLDVYSASDESAAGVSYGFTADVIEPSKLEMRSSPSPPPEYGSFTELPSDLPAVFLDTAQRVTAGQDTQFDRARALESWFHDSGTFDYSIEPEAVNTGSNLDSLADFLVNTKTGYCEQFATSMAIMARTLEIPSRVAVGFLQPEHVEGNTWEFKGTDMHAWPELYFSGVGWVRFEPTPNTIDSIGSEPIPFANSQEGSTPTSPGGPTLTGPDRTAQSLRQQASEAVGGGGGGGSDGPTTMLWVAPLIVFGSALLVSLPRITRSVVRRRRWSRADGSAATAEAAWAELRDRTLDLRMEWDAGATPRTIGRSLREHLPHGLDPHGPVVSALNRLVLAIEQGRYARSIRHSENLREAVDTVAEVLATGRTPRQRFLARWLPASLFRARRRTTVRNERLGELLVSVED